MKNSREFCRAMVRDMYARELSPDVLDHIADACGSWHTKDPYVAGLVRRLLERHTKRPGRPFRSGTYMQRVAEAVIWIRFNRNDLSKIYITDELIKSVAQKYDVQVKTLRRAINGKDKAINEIIRTLPKNRTPKKSNPVK